MINYMFFSACIITFINIGTVFCFREKPKLPPSQAAVSSSKEKYDMKKDLNSLVTNKNYLLLVVVFGMLFGVYSTLGAIIDNLATSYKYSSK